MSKKLFISLSLLIPLSWFYAEANAAEAQQLREPLPSQDSPEYWVLRSEAVRELTSFMTKKRKELKDKYTYFPGYLEEIGKAADFRSSGRKIPGDPKYRLEVLGLLDAFEQRNIQLSEKPMNWTQVINVAMQFVWAEGHLETNIESGEELQRFKQNEFLDDEKSELFRRSYRIQPGDIVDVSFLYKNERFQRYLTAAQNAIRQDYRLGERASFYPFAEGRLPAEKIIAQKIIYNTLAGETGTRRRGGQ